MSRRSRHVLGAIAIILVLATGYVMKFGLYPRYFDIAWDEEVQLHDGRMIVVHVKRFYQRKGLMLERYPKDPYRLGMEFSFDTGLSGKRFTHHFKRGNLNFLDQKDGNWYIGYYADIGDASTELGSRELYPHVAILKPDGTVLKPKAWNEVPREINEVNIMPSTPDEAAISKFNGTRLTLQTKQQHWTAYPTGAGEHTIQRITPQLINQGKTK